MSPEEIILCERTEEHVKEYFLRTQDEEIQKMCPQQARSVEEALSDYCNTLKPGASSFGRIIYKAGKYVGDVWCYCIHEDEEPDAMLSYCIFDKCSWGQGIATAAVGQFIREAADRFQLTSIGAFTYDDNKASIRVLEKNGFVRIESFMEEGRSSGYFLLEVKS